MREPVVMVFLFLALGLVQCSSEAPAGADLGASDGPSASTDLPATAAVQCADTVCSANQRCCGSSDVPPVLSCAPSCPAGAVVDAVCDGPEDCGADAPYCCGTVAVGAGVPPSCAFSGVKASCAQSCRTNLGLQCNMTATVRACRRAADCADDAASSSCCEFTRSGLTLTFCVNALFRAGATRCLP